VSSYEGLFRYSGILTLRLTMHKFDSGAALGSIGTLLR